MPSHTTQAIAERVGGDLDGPADLTITGLEELALAQPGQLSFVGEPRYAGRWPQSRASAALVNRDIALEPGDGRALIRVDNADLAMALALEMFAPDPVLPEPGVHPTSTVDPTADLGANVRIGPGCYVGPRARVGANSVLHANVTLLHDVVVGEGCTLWPGVVVRERCSMGERCILHPNVNLGADGFGYRPAPDGKGLVKIPQIGTVELGSDVELGAGVCIDRGKFSATRLGDGCKLDNMVQIGHNTRLGRCVIISGSAAVAGSCTIGDGAMIGGLTAIKDHMTIGAGARIAGASVVMHDIPAGETWGGMPAQPLRETMQQHLAVKKLPDLLRQLKQLRKG